MESPRNKRFWKHPISRPVRRSWSQPPKSSWPRKLRAAKRRSNNGSLPRQRAPILALARAALCYSQRRCILEYVMSDRPAGSVDPKLLEILVCPLTKGPLEYDAEKQELISRSAKLAYPIRAGIPIMLPEEARRLDGWLLKR